MISRFHAQGPWVIDNPPQTGFGSECITRRVSKRYRRWESDNSPSYQRHGSRAKQSGTQSWPLLGNTEKWDDRFEFHDCPTGTVGSYVRKVKRWTDALRNVDQMRQSKSFDGGRHKHQCPPVCSLRSSRLQVYTWNEAPRLACLILSVSPG